MSEIITDLGFDPETIWKMKNFDPHPYPQKTWPLLKDLGLKKLEEIEGEDLRVLQEGITKPMIKGAFRHFYNDKIEKLAHMWVLISGSIAGGMWMGWPNENYDYPALVMAWEESKKRLHIIIDLMPMVDVVEYESYREKYLDPIEPVFNEYKDLIGPPSTYRWFRAQLGPYNIFDGPSGQRERALTCQMEYIKHWAELVKNAEPMEDGPYKEYVNKRKRTIQLQLRQRDPLGSVLIRTMGEELGKKCAIGYT